MLHYRPLPCPPSFGSSSSDSHSTLWPHQNTYNIPAPLHFVVYPTSILLLMLSLYLEYTSLCFR